MTNNEARRLIDTDPDFVFMKRFDYSLDKLMERYPDGAPAKIIAQAMMMTEDEVEELYEAVIVKMRQALRVELD